MREGKKEERGKKRDRDTLGDREANMYIAITERSTYRVRDRVSACECTYVCVCVCVCGGGGWNRVLSDEHYYSSCSRR